MIISVNMSDKEFSNQPKFPDVPLVTERDEVIGRCQLSEVRERNLPGRVARVLLTSNKFVLLQERSMTVDQGGVLDCSSDGWVDYEDASGVGEMGDYRAAAVRETKEELGLSIAREDLTEIAHYLFESVIVNTPEWTKLFVVEYQPEKHGEIKPNEEVTNTEWIELTEAQRLSEHEPERFELGTPLALAKLAMRQ